MRLIALFVFVIYHSPRDLTFPRQYHVLCATSQGVFTWGDPGQGRLGLGDELVREATPKELPDFKGREVISVACSIDVSLAVTGIVESAGINQILILLIAEGEVYSWGNSTCYQLGLEDSVAYKPEKIKMPIPIGKVVCGLHHVLALSQGIIPIHSSLNL